MNFWTPKEFVQFMNSLDTDEHIDYFYYVLFYTLFFIGVRIGELLALSWNDIDFHRRERNINKSNSRIKKQDFITTSKTKSSIRRISINQKLCDLFLDWNEKQESYFIHSLGIPNPKISRIFQLDIEDMTRFKVQKKIIAYVEKVPKLMKIRIHDFRQSHVALLIDNKEEPLTISKRIGHSSLSFILDRYDISSQIDKEKWQIGLIIFYKKTENPLKR